MEMRFFFLSQAEGGLQSGEIGQRVLGVGPVSSGSRCLWGDLPYLWHLWAHTAESSLIFGINN